MADFTSIPRRTLLNHLPAPAPDWAARWLAGERRRRGPWADKLAASRRLQELIPVYDRVDSGHPLAARLARADCPPLELWRKGDIPPPPYLTVVGPRQPSEVARQLTSRLIARVAPFVTIVSGLARGIDSLALETALSSGGRVIAIPPLGLSEAMASPLARAVSGQGAVVAERLFVAALSKSHFLFRNRLLAAVADAVYLPEAAERSGTYNTVTHAIRLGAAVLVSPGDVGRLGCAASNRLIRDGAAVILDPEDLAGELGLALPPAPCGDPLLKPLQFKPLTAAELAEKNNRPLAQTLAQLAAAQAAGQVAVDWLGRWRLLAGTGNS